MPTVFLPGIGATMRTLGTRRAMARSSARPVILLSRRPASSSTSNWAMTGPVSISTTRTLKPKSRNVFSRILALRRTSFSCSSKLNVSPGQQQVDRRQLVVRRARAHVGFVQFFEDRFGGSCVFGRLMPTRDAERLRAVGGRRLFVSSCSIFVCCGSSCLRSFAVFLVGRPAADANGDFAVCRIGIEVVQIGSRRLSFWA